MDDLHHPNHDVYLIAVTVARKEAWEIGKAPKDMLVIRFPQRG